MALPVARIYLGLCVLHDFPSRRFWWEGPDLTPKNIGPAKRFTPHNKSQKFLNSRVSTKNQTEELCVIRTTLEYLRKQNRQIRLDERYSDGIRLLIVLCNDYIPVPNFCIFKIKRLMIERT